MTIRLYKNSWRTVNSVQLYYGTQASDWRTVDAVWRYTDLYGWRQIYPNVAEPTINITLIETTENSATIYWTVEDATSVLVEVFLQTNLSTPVFSTSKNGSSPNSQLVTGLLVNTGYQARLTATASSGAQTTVTQNFNTTNQRPSAPLNISASSGRVDGINVTWNTPANAGGSPITDYEIQRSQDPVAILSQTTWTAGLGVVNSYLATGVDPLPTTYYFRVRAVNSFGAGTPSAVSNAGSKIAATQVTIAANNTTIPRNSFTLLVARIKNNGVNVSAPNIPITFRIYGSGSFSSTSTITIQTINSDANGQASLNYYSSTTTGLMYVTVETPGLSGDLVGITVVGVAPSSPTSFSGSSNSTGTAVNLSWAAPIDNGGGAITSYELQRNQSSTPGDSWINVGNVTSWTSSGLNSGTTYYFRIRAINGFGTGPYSEIQVTTATVPGAPTSLTGSSNSDGTIISLSWGAPISNGGSAITGYQLQRNQSSTPGDSWISIGLVTSWDSNTSPGTTYYFRVRAINDVGTGAFSTVVVTSSTPTTAPPTTSPPTTAPPTAPPPKPPATAPPPTSPPPKGASLGPDTRVLTRDFGFMEVKYLSVGDVLVSMNIEEVPVFGSDFDVDNWSSSTFTNLGTTYTTVSNIYARQVIGTMVRINGEWFTDNHNILVEKDGTYYFKQSIDIDETYKVFDYDVMDWIPVIDIFKQEGAESIVYVVDSEPYDVFFTENALVYNRKEYFR